MAEDEATVRGWDQIWSTFVGSTLLGTFLYGCFESGRRVNNGRTSAYGGNYMQYYLSPYGNKRKVSRYVDEPDPDGHDVEDGYGKVEEGPQLPDRPTYMYGWLVPVIKVDGDQGLLDLVGLDAYILLRFLKMMARIFLFAAFWGLSCLVPFYEQGEQGTADTFYHTTMANIEQGSDNIWVTTFFAYLFCAHAFFLIDAEYKAFMGLRNQFFLHGTRETVAQARYSILVEGVPRHLRTSSALYKYFDEIFPGKVHSAVVCLDTSKLARLMRARERVAALLESYILLDHLEPEEAPHCVRPWADKGLGDDDVERSAKASSEALSGKEGTATCCARWANVLCRCSQPKPVPAVKFLQRLLDLVNEEVIESQQKYRDDAKRAELLAQAQLPLLSSMLFHMEQNITNVIDIPREHIDTAFAAPDAPGMPPAGPSLESDTSGQSLESDASEKDGSVIRVREDEGSTLRLRRASSTASVEGSGSLRRRRKLKILVPQESSTFSLRDSLGIPRQATREMNQMASPTSPTSPSPMSPRLSDPPGSLQSSLLHEAHPVGGVDDEEEAGPKWSPTDKDSKHLPSSKDSDARWLQGLGMTGVQGAKAVGKSASNQVLDSAQFVAATTVGNLARAFATLEALTLGSNVSSTGFVTFNSLATRETAHQALLTHRNDEGNVRMEAIPAPDPRDIVWSNVHKPLREMEPRRQAASIEFFLLAVLFNVPIQACVAATNKDSLMLAIPSLEQYEHDWWFETLASYLPSLASLGIVQLTPLIFLLSAYTYEHFKGKVKIETTILKRYFNVQLAFVYITVTAGSVLDALADVLKNPEQIMTILANALPGQSSYFMGLIIIKAVQGLSWELSRLHVFVPYLLCAGGRSKKKGERETMLRDDPRAPPYGWIFPSALMAVIVGFCFQVVCPLVSVICFLYFFMAYIVYKHQFLFVYINTTESGGVFFFPVFSRIIVGMIAGQLTLSGYLGIKLAYSQAGMVFLLVPWTVAFYYRMKNRYERPAVTLSLEQAAVVDHYLDSRAQAPKRTLIEPVTELLHEPVEEEAKSLEMQPRRSVDGAVGDDADDEPEYIDYRPMFSDKTYQQPELRDMEPVVPLPSRWMN
uniref:CSC1/OSCA1-like 7TM region domain-containing protein n=1 Tax=Phaeomonas parva TaxID=124430 RepID=A0A7S1XL44_9STRA|mmetsp:Transcript_14099/g.42185  ORF Transcript_14099/g.42185 Transcript_14099/m.42185 type:complete len:1099 (+) Transcript_14099:286-3582(+)|eukprot:CAMPEP_0118852614 /NCGR_PEP_ID=MMETSP1163-20130328/1541_1 /TAXON_ID=124430 /ORGANISM="Phaeomonas parva, Strain CCMP2877" /LENGTH=1098 /DNA_ID=CAMNT_0006785059 /DNA_START=231 /DNA_END=3527 /DNA_ORIENTATION=+